MWVWVRKLPLDILSAAQFGLQDECFYKFFMYSQLIRVIHSYVDN
jgi:hypothetical protein